MTARSSVGAQPVGQPRGDLAGLVGSDGSGRTERGRPLASGGHRVDGHDRAGGVELGAQDGGQADGSGADDGDGIAGLDVAVEDADLVAGRQDVGEVDDLLVGEPLGDLVGRGVGERHAGVLGLDAVDQVPEDPAASAEALAVLVGSAEPAASAGGDARQQHPVPLADRPDAGAGLQDRADGFVAEDPAGGDLGDVALEDVQIGAAVGDDGSHGLLLVAEFVPMSLSVGRPPPQGPTSQARRDLRRGRSDQPADTGVSETRIVLLIMLCPVRWREWPVLALPEMGCRSGAGGP